MFYAAVNSYATETSIGFANTWGVLGFATRQMRDAYVRQANDLATRSITSKEISAYGGRHGQISYYDADGNLHQHMQHGEFACGGVRIDPVTAKTVDSWRWNSFTEYY